MLIKAQNASFEAATPFWETLTVLMCRYGPHIDRFYDSQQSEHTAVLMSEWSSWGSRQAAQMGFDGRVAGWTLPRVRCRPLSHLYCPVQTTWGLITGSEGEQGSLCPCSITRYHHGSTNGNYSLIHWFNQSWANMRASSRVKARDVWFLDTDDGVISYSDSQ